MPPDSRLLFGQASSEAEQAEFFDRVREGFLSASSRTGEVLRDYCVAGIPVRLRFAGDALMAPLLPALANPQPAAAVAPKYEICLWDSESTGVSMTPCPRSHKDFTACGNIWGFDSPRYRSAYQWSENSLSAMDRETGSAVFWLPRPDRLPTWTLAAPLRTLLHWIMELNGRQLVHAAAIGAGDNGALLVGRSGAGKSSTALACLEHGLDFLSDDYLAVALDPEPVAYRLFNTAKVDPGALHLYPGTAQSSRVVMAPDCEKAVFFLDPARLRNCLPIRQTLKPRVAGAPDTSFGPAAAREIEHALAGEMLTHLPHAGAHTLDFLERMSLQLPASTVHAGTDRARLASAIRSALGHAPAHRVNALPAAPPAISMVVYCRDDDRAALRALAESIAAQDYRRAELMAIAEGEAVRMEDEVARLPGNVRFSRCDRPANKPAAWNRGVRETLGELLLFIEMEDRLGCGALAAFAAASQHDPDSSVFRAEVQFHSPEESLRRPLAGALIRRDAFRKHGLFDARLASAGSTEREWLARTAANINACPAILFRAGPAPAAPRVDLAAIKQQLDRQRQRP